MTKHEIRANVIGAIVGAIIGSLIGPIILVTIIWPMLTPERDIRRVIELEASLVLEGKPYEAVLLFDENAYIMDAAGGNINFKIVWHGRAQIIERYSQLPRFVYLRHEAIAITISSDNTYARAIADTIGTYESDGGLVVISSNQGEKWTLRKINNEWKITSFIYNLPP